MTDTPKRMSERAGCLIAWLILLLIALGLGSVVYFYIGVVMIGQDANDQGMYAITLALTFSIGAAGAAALLSRKRLGFWMLAGSFVFAALLQLIGALRIDLALAGLINVGIIWWFLRPVWRKLD